MIQRDQATLTVTARAKSGRICSSDKLGPKTMNSLSPNFE